MAVKNDEIRKAMLKREFKLLLQFLIPYLNSAHGFLLGFLHMNVGALKNNVFIARYRTNVPMNLMFTLDPVIYMIAMKRLRGVILKKFCNRISNQVQPF